MLLGLMTDPRTARATMTGREAGWLRAIEERLDLTDARLEATFDQVQLRIARAAFGLLTA